MASFISFASVLVIAGMVAAQNNTACTFGYWGEDCMNYCGECYVEDTRNATIPKCDRTTGYCPDGCVGDYGGKLCNQPKCPNGCGSGQCVYPGLCANCGDISKVSPNCEDIRVRGLLGSLIAFVVIITSISFCGFGSVWYKRRKNTAVSL